MCHVVLLITLTYRCAPQGGAVQEPFRHSLSHAVQWYDVLQVQVEHRVEEIIESCRQMVSKNFEHTQSTEHPLSSSTTVTTAMTGVYPPLCRQYSYPHLQGHQ